MGRAVSVSLQTGGVGLKDEYEPGSPHVGDVLTDEDSGVAPGAVVSCEGFDVLPAHVDLDEIEDLEDSPFADSLPEFCRSVQFDGPDSPGPGIRHRIAFSRGARDGQTLREYDPQNDMLDRLDQLAELVEDDA